MADFGITSTGISVPRLIDFLDAMDASYEADTGIDLDSSNSANARDVLVRFNGYVAGLLDDLGQQVQAIVDIIDPEAASGRQLSSLARIIGVIRIPGSYSTVTLNCTGDPGTTLPAFEAIAEGGITPAAELARWVNTTDIVFDGFGVGQGVFQAESRGPYTALAGQVSGIVTKIAGWDTVTNAIDAAVGTSEETDQALRVRMRTARASRAGCGIPGIRSRILQLDFIQACLIIANGDSETKLVRGFSMPSNSYLVVVLPNQLTIAQQQQVLGVLYDSVVGTGRSVGTDVDGAVVNLEDGTSWPVSFDYGADLTVSLAFTITPKVGNSVADIEAALQPGLRALLPKGLAEEVLQSELCGIASATGLVKDVDTLIQGVDANFAPQITERVTAFSMSVNGRPAVVVTQ